MKFIMVNDRTPSKQSSCCAVSQSEQAICGTSEPGCSTAIMIATPITAGVPSRLSQASPEYRRVSSRHLK
jgi:hypothetical protein